MLTIIKTYNRNKKIYSQTNIKMNIIKLLTLEDRLVK